MTTILSDRDVTDLALRLRATPPGNRSGAATHHAVPVGSAGAAVGAQIDRFRHVARVVCAALGPATVRGAYDGHRPFDSTGPSWGDPYLRWRRPAPGDTVELLAGADGPELVLHATGPAEDRFGRQSGGDTPVGGTLCELSWNEQAYVDARAAHGHSFDGYEIPGVTLVEDWPTFERALGRWLTTVSAEQAALELSFGPVVAGSGGLGLDVLPGRDRLVVGAFLPDTVDAAALGWLPPDAVADDPYGGGGPEWRLLGGPAGRVDGTHLARVLVATARACGLTGPRDLRIIDGKSSRLSDGTNYWHTYFGLGLDHDR